MKEEKSHTAGTEQGRHQRDMEGCVDTVQNFSLSSLPLHYHLLTWADGQTLRKMASVHEEENPRAQFLEFSCGLADRI